MDLKQQIDLEAQYNEYLVECACAKTTLEAIISNMELQMEHSVERNLIADLDSRLKTFESTYKKCEKKGHDLTIESIRENIRDVVGLRIITLYRDDVFAVAKELEYQDIEIIERKDYITNPKPNGYSSLHLVVRVPVKFNGRTRFIYAEIQIRTIGMQMWASIEHDQKYKVDVESLHPSSEDHFKSMADTVHEFEEISMRLRDYNINAKKTLSQDIS